MKNEAWKEEVLSSLNGLQRAEPDPQLYGRVRLKVFGAPMRVMSPSFVAAVAAGLVLLVYVNIQVLQQKPVDRPQSSTYVLENTNFNLYP